MDNPLLDDVKALLDKDFGDDRILKQICRAFENNEVISNYERNYVLQLAEKHLGRRSTTMQTKPSVGEKPPVPDVVMPGILTPQKAQAAIPSKPKRLGKIISFNSKKSKIMWGIVGIVLLTIIAGAVLSGGPTITIFGPVPFSVQTDLSSYNAKDIISISGNSDTSEIVSISIINPDNVPIWSEQISPKSNGKYSTLTIAGGLGWENSGTYTIMADNGGEETISDTFSFTS